MIAKLIDLPVGKLEARVVYGSDVTATP